MHAIDDVPRSPVVNMPVLGLESSRRLGLMPFLDTQARGHTARRDDRRGGYTDRDDRGGGGYNGRDDRGGGGYSGRDDRGGGGHYDGGGRFGGGGRGGGRGHGRGDPQLAGQATEEELVRISMHPVSLKAFWSTICLVHAFHLISARLYASRARRALLCLTTSGDNAM
jgi:hypothetical protein